MEICKCWLTSFLSTLLSCLLLSPCLILEVQGFSKVVILYHDSVQSFTAVLAPVTCWNMFSNTNSCLHCVSFISRNNRCVTDRWLKITLSMRYHDRSSSLALYFPQTNKTPPLIQYCSVSRRTDSVPPPPLAGFFWFPFVPSFSRLTPQLSVCGQRSTALSQVPAGTAATGFTRRRH